MSTPDNDDLSAEFPELVELLRGGLPEAPSERPSEHVWEAIAAELGRPPMTQDGDPPGGRAAITKPADGIGPVATGPDEPEATVHRLSDRRSRAWGRPLAAVTAAAAALLVGIPLVLASRGDDPTTVRRAELAALPGWSGDGEALLEDHSLTVSLHGGSAPDGAYYELWLLDLEGDDLRDLRSLGPVDIADDGSFTVPADLDLDRFHVVDVSIEPDDGNPEHSGNSILRGDLAEA